MYANRPARGLFIVAAALVAVGLVAGSADADPPYADDLRLWLDASDLDSFTFDSDDSDDVDYVAQWDDLSDYNHHAQAKSLMPIRVSDAIGGQPAVLFSRSGGDSTALDIAGDFEIDGNDRRTAFMVMKYTTADATSDSNFILGTYVTNVVNLGKVKPVSGTEQMRLHFENLTEDSAEGTVPGNQDTVLAVRSEQGTAHTTTAYSNGDPIIDTTTYAFHWPIRTNLQVGGANWDDYAYQGYIAEVLLYNRTLSNSEMFSVGNYLEQKYNIATRSGGRYGIPEPSAMLLALVGLLCVVGRRCGKRSA